MTRWNRATRQDDSVRLERLPYDPVAWEATLERYPSAEVFHSSAWLDFLAASQGAEPVVAVVREAGQPVGHFVGGIVRKFGIRILGSPLRGWSTESMGFLLEEGVNRRAAASALLPFAFGELGCLHVEIADKLLTAEQMVGSDYVAETGATFLVDLEPPEEAILGAMNSSARNYIRHAADRGLRAEIATDLNFADEYYDQLREAFARQGLAPTYGVGRVRQLIRSLESTGQLLLLRVRAQNGNSAATAVVVGRNKTAALWGNTIRRAEAKSRPDEFLHWEAMRYWRARGASRFDMGGSGDYKVKFGGAKTPTVRFHRSRFAVLRLGRVAVRHVARARQVISMRTRGAAHPELGHLESSAATENIGLGY